MATLNGAAYLPQQLRSLGAQIRPPDELIVTDDASRDDTGGVVERFAKTAPFEVRFYRNRERLGYAQNFGRALSLATGEIVFLCDQDDAWFPAKISRLESLFRDDRVLAAMNDAELADAELTPSGCTVQSQIRAAGLDIEYFVMGCCAAFRHSFLRLMLPIPQGIRAHDNWLVQFATGLGGCKVVPEVLQSHRRHGNNESKSFTSTTKRVTRWRSLLERLSAGMRSGIDDLLRRREEAESARERLLAVKGALAVLSSEADVDRYEQALSRTIEVLGRRCAVRSAPRGLERFRLALSMWREGLYPRAHNLLKDLIG